MSSPIKILLVDDIEQNLVVLRALLARPGLELLCAHSGSEALELLLDHQVALALLDVHMPGMDGFELAELMRGSPRTRQIPIIFVTATDRNVKRTFRGYDAGAVDFLYKPFDPHILRSKVEVFVKLYAGQQHQAEQLVALQEALRTNDMLVAVLGHDLRNPLSAIMSLGELVARSGENERTRNLGERICSSGARMGRLIDHILDIALMRAGKLKINPVEASLHEICQNIVGEFAVTHDAERIVIESCGSTRGEWDVDHLSQVISNLVGNAVQHGAQEPVHVLIQGSCNDRVKVQVSNTGRIAPEVAAKMFKPFERDPASPHKAGLGLGLYISNELVKLHQGSIDVRSEHNKVVFEVDLPRSCRAQ